MGNRQRAKDQRRQLLTTTSSTFATPQFQERDQPASNPHGRTKRSIFYFGEPLHKSDGFCTFFSTNLEG